MDLKPTYKKQYPDINSEEFEREIEDIWQKEKNPHVKRILEKLKRKTRYVQKPDAFERISELVCKAKEFCDEYYIDIEMFEEEDSVLIKIYVLSMLYEGKQKEQLCELISLADVFTVDVHGGGDFNYSIALMLSAYDVVYEDEQ